MAGTVNVRVVGGPQVDVTWTAGMNAQQALELARNALNSTQTFTFGLQYYGPALGYMVFMINETFDSFLSTAAPYYYWQFFVNDVSQDKGIDGTMLSDGDCVKFDFDLYDSSKHKGTMMEKKYNFQRSVR